MTRRKVKAKAPKERAPSDIAIEVFRTAFKAHWGFNVIVERARDRTLMKKLIELWGLDEVVRLIPAFLERPNCRFYNIPDFYYWAPHIRLPANPNGHRVHPKTAANMAEGLKAMKGK